MAKALTDDAVRRFHAEGYLGPIPVLSADEARAARSRLEDFERRHPDWVGKLDLKAHLLFPWLDDLVRRPAIGDAFEALLGPDVMLWNTTFRNKPPDGRAFVTWHQDTKYITLQPIVVIGWLALSEASRESGCLEVIPGSHRWGLLRHRDGEAPDNMLTRGQCIDEPFDESAKVALELAPGEMAFIHYGIVHRSGPNRASDRRIGLLIDCVPTHADQASGRRESAMLLRGEDAHHNFLEDPRPAGELTPEALEAHRRAVEAQTATMYEGSEVEPVALD